MIRRFTYCFVLVLSASSGIRAQGEAKELDSVIVISGTGKSDDQTTVTLNQLRIERRLADDAGKILSLFPGIQIKSYGGLGGMKSVSFHSLGAGHTSIVSDGFALSQTQSGQTDVGQLPVDFIEKIELVSQAGMSVLYPIQSRLSGQMIAIQTRHLHHNHSAPQLNAGVQSGSFGQYGMHLFVRRNIRSWQFSFSGKARMFNGAYPFEYTNANNTIHTTRNNGDLKDLYGTVAIGYRVNAHHLLRTSWSGSGYNKGLPGAVVFYNETAGQRLYGSNQLFTLQHHFTSGRLESATSASLQFGTLNYVDSNYLNSAGYLHNTYQSRENGIQSQCRFACTRYWSILAGAGVRHEQLRTEVFNSTPSRTSTDGIIALTNSNNSRQLAFQLGIQSVNDRRPAHSRNTFVILPSVEWKTLITGQTGYSVSYRYTQRQPSFNELYYNQVGNLNLVPEKAQLAGLRFFTKSRRDKNSSNWFFEESLQPFYTFVQDKILATPTKNLFIWSIQNIGKSDAFGIELQQHTTARFNRVTCTLHLQYTWMHTRDLSKPGTSTYKNQLSYTPAHTGTAEFDVTYKQLGWSLLLSYTGQRYALLQNIPANLLNDYLLADMSVSWQFKAGQQQFIARIAVNNLTNNYYSYIRYFVMPGINWALRLSWELNGNRDFVNLKKNT